MSASPASHTPWCKAILIPFWFLQLGLDISLIVLFALSGDCLSRELDKYGSYSDARTQAQTNAEQILFPIWLLILCLYISLTLSEIILFTRRKLKPLSLLITNVIKSTVWVVLPILEIISVVDNKEYYTTAAIFISIEASLLLFFWVHLVYAGVIYHQFRKNARLHGPDGHPDSNLILQNQQCSMPTTDYSTYPSYKGYVPDP